MDGFYNVFQCILFVISVISDQTDVEVYCKKRRVSQEQFYQFNVSAKNSFKELVQEYTFAGKWETDYGLEATCRQSQAGVLEYCKQVETWSHFA